MNSTIPEQAGEKHGRRAVCWLFAALIAGALVTVSLVTFLPQASHNEIADPAIPASGLKKSHNEIIGPALLKSDAKHLKQTIVTSHDEAPIRPGQNVLWCSTFQLVWNEACRQAGGDIHMANEPAIVPILNKKNASQDDVDPASCLVVSGRLEAGIAGKIRKELAEKFQGQADPDLLNSVERELSGQGYAQYAYLFRNLPFQYRFEALQSPLRFLGGSSVTPFGIHYQPSDKDDRHRAEQIRVLDYKSDDDFIVSLQPKDAKERVILSKIAPADTLQKTVDAVRSRIRASGLKPEQQVLRADESLVVPMLNIDVRQSYDELCGKIITTPGPLDGAYIALALQGIRFRLDEEGAMLKSEALMVEKAAEEKAPAQWERPRELLFDKPFLILLERRDAQRPYFALWVGNAELLKPWK